ncbi:MAG: hypothetical protein AB1505_21120 [Candidatus Latescibacterota bacterium]
MNERHATLEELLAVRDGEGSPWAKTHVAACGACGAERDRLEGLRARLRALPAVALPPGERWPRLAGLAVRQQRRWRARRLLGLAAAAALAVIAVRALRPAGGDDGASQRVALGRAMRQSEVLEQALKALGPERQALPGQVARAAAELEAQLWVLDAQLAEPGIVGARPERLTSLWQQRAGVLSALVDVHTTRMARAGL